jgi:hypothetical protein
MPVGLNPNPDKNDADAQPSLSGQQLQRLKPFLRYGIPYADPETAQWEPMLQWSETAQVPLAHLQQGIRALLEALKPAASTATLHCQAVGLSRDTLHTALQSLESVIVSYATNWPDTYSYNIREAILSAQLVTNPAKIFFVEEAIAAVLSALPRFHPTATTARSPQNVLPQSLRSGQTLVLSAGATMTELGIVEVPSTLSQLTFEAFDLRSISYAGDALDQDIVCYLLYPHGQQQFAQSQTLLPPGEAEGSNPAQAQFTQEASAEPESESANGQPWDWQLHFADHPIAAWKRLALDQMELPRQGEPDPQRREALRRRLQSSILGQSLLKAAQHLKRVLQQQPQFIVALGTQRWLIRRQDFEQHILLPYVQLLNRHVNTLLSKTGIATEGIRQAICTGGTASYPAIARWLRQKLPNATVIQDTYPANRPPTCSRVAYGLVNLPYYPQALDLARQQYNDYFLLLELLRAFPQQPLSISRIMQRLEHRGINTQICYLHIMALLEGHLPPGLVPVTTSTAPLRSHPTSQSRYSALKSQPLFHKQQGQVYIPNPAQRQRLQDYFTLVFAHKHQTLDEPLLAQLAVLSGS